MGSCRCGETLITIRAIIAGLSVYETAAVNFRSETKTFIILIEQRTRRYANGNNTEIKIIFILLFNNFLVPLNKPN